MTEPEQIELIASVVRSGASIGFMVDNDAKAERLIQKLGKLCPGMEVKFRGPMIEGKPAILVRVEAQRVDPSNN